MMVLDDNSLDRIVKNINLTGVQKSRPDYVGDVVKALGLRDFVRALRSNGPSFDISAERNVLPLHRRGQQC